MISRKHPPSCWSTLPAPSASRPCWPRPPPARAPAAVRAPARPAPPRCRPARRPRPRAAIPTPRSTSISGPRGRSPPIIATAGPTPCATRRPFSRPLWARGIPVRCPPASASR
ncbi:hypothetical protein CVM50_14975 [Pseudooceanicola marinus]|nr:hypothetical protein CVM50_14975 [Pseudooceanicola marinus]